MTDPSIDLRRTTWSGALAAAVFVVVSWLTTQVETLRAAMPFTDDPWDAVVSFALIGIGVIGGATIVRAMGQLGRPDDPAVERRIAIGATLSASVAAVALGSDLVAVLLVGIDPSIAETRLGLAMLAVAVLVTFVALAFAWQTRAVLRRPTAEPSAEPDLLDAIGSIAGTLGARTIGTTFTRWTDRSTLSPRRHRILVGVIGGIAAGIAAVAWHALREGPWASPAAATLFGLLMTLGVAGAYLLCLEPLRIIRRAG